MKQGMDTDPLVVLYVELFLLKNWYLIQRLQHNSEEAMRKT